MRIKSVPQLSLLLSPTSTSTDKHHDNLEEYDVSSKEVNDIPRQGYWSPWRGVWGTDDVDNINGGNGGIAGGGEGKEAASGGGGNGGNGTGVGKKGKYGNSINSGWGRRNGGSNGKSGMNGTLQNDWNGASNASGSSGNGNGNDDGGGHKSGRVGASGSNGGKKQNMVVVNEGKAMLPRLRIVWGLLNEPCLQYNLIALERYGEDLVTHPIHRLRQGDVLYLENEQGRFEITAWQRDHVGQDEASQDHFVFRLARIKDDTIKKLIARNAAPYVRDMQVDSRLHRIPLPDELVDIKSKLMDSKEITWDSQQFKFGDFSFPVHRISWASRSPQEDKNPLDHR